MYRSDSAFVKIYQLFIDQYVFESLQRAISGVFMQVNSWFRTNLYQVMIIFSEIYHKSIINEVFEVMIHSICNKTITKNSSIKEK